MMTMSPFKYAPEVPKEYLCSKCGAHPVKLWREYNRIASVTDLYCLECACKDQKKEVDAVVNEFGKFKDGDQIAWLVPAVPTEDGSTYWGYTSVPDPGVYWWKSLPLRKVSD